MITARFYRTFFVFAFLVATIFAILVADASAQRRDYLTDEEIELIRDAQEIDLRVVVLTRAIDRRFTQLGIDSGGWTPKEKDLEKWGQPATGTEIQLFDDVKRLLVKAIDDIDNIAAYDNLTEETNKMGGKLFPVAVRSLAASARRYGPLLATSLEKTDDEKLRGVLMDAIEACEQIIDAESKLPPPTEKEKKKNKKNDK